MEGLARFGVSQRWHRRRGTDLALRGPRIRVRRPERRGLDGGIDRLILSRGAAHPPSGNAPGAIRVGVLVGVQFLLRARPGRTETALRGAHVQCRTVSVEWDRGP